ncbi:MAG: SusC/RagA family TonB-linked outer membrane protein [Gemmatimonadota bacterium]|nr:SusC/RagA family TonB-linked outer membrane protein [Gemmatimonadota bacterium]
MPHRVLGLLAALAVLGVPAAAQVREVTGRVTSTQTDQGVAEALIAVEGTGIATRSATDGRFVVNIPDGDQTLTVSAIGFKRDSLVVPATNNTVTVTLEPDPFKLQEVVVTGQSTGIEKQNLPNAVATVGADELTRAPTGTLESALQGKIPGALIQANSGAPGGGIQVNLRGVSTITAGAEPLFVVDGIVVSNEAIPNGANAVTGAQSGGNPQNQDNPTSRIADLNPEDIERIEVLKGGSAAAIYGSKATNGVIIITTKRGQQGKPQFNITQRLGTFWRANQLGSRTFATLADAQAAFNPDTTVERLFNQAGGQVFDNEDFLYGRNDLSYETSASVNGGTELTRYFISGLVKNDEGIATNTGYKKQSFRANLDQSLGSWLLLSANANVTHSRSRRGLSNNDNASTSPYVVFPFTPNFVDLRAGDSIPEDQLIAADFPLNPFSLSNPLQTFSFLKNEEDTWRTLGTVTARATLLSRPKHTWQLITIGGVDYFEQDNNFVSPPELEFEPNDGQAGTVVLSKASNLNLNLAVNSNYTFIPASGAVQSTFSAGVQYEDRDLDATRILARSLLSGQENPDQATSVTPFQDDRLVRDLGVYGQEELLLLDRRLLLTGGLRADKTSSNGSTGKFFFYPKAAASYRLIRPLGGVDEIKFRGAFGQTGNQPLFGAKFSPDTTGTIGGIFGVIPGNRAGDALIRPERQSEFEAGFDAQLANGRAELNFSVYQRTISDLILEQTIAPSIGQETRIFSSDSKLRNRGLEVALSVSPVQTRDVNWLFRTTFFLNRSKIDTLDVPAFETGGFGTSLGAFFIQQGASATQIVGNEGVVGDANPDFQATFSNDVTWKSLSLGFLFDWKQGGDIVNLTEFLYDAGQNSVDFVGAGEARVAAFNDPVNPQTQVYVQDGSYLKLREVTLAYNLADNLTRRLFGGNARYARLSVSARNLLRFTGYRGLDPEVSNFGNQAIIRNIDVAPFPPSKSFFFAVDLGF